MTAGLAIAGDNVSADQILNALQPKKPLTRGLSAGPQADPAVSALVLIGAYRIFRLRCGSHACRGQNPAKAGAPRSV